MPDWCRVVAPIRAKCPQLGHADEQIEGMQGREIMKIEHATVDAPLGQTASARLTTDTAASTRMAKRLQLGPIAQGLSVAVTSGSSLTPTTAAETIRDLLADLVLGVRTRGGAAPAGGEVEVNSSLGRFRLKRRFDNAGQVRYAVAGLDGQSVSRETVDQLLGQAGSGVLAKVFYSTPSTHGDLPSLLSKEVARYLQDHEQPPTVQSALATDDLLARRDAVAREIESRLADRRRQSEADEARLVQLDAEIAELQTQRGAIEKVLQGVESDLASVESHLRYRAIAEQTERAASAREASDWRSRIEELEAQIGQWRGTLSELEGRQAEVENELSVIHPDDAEPALPLADQRAGIAVACRLVEDLESEVARLARSAASDACVCRDAHPRLNPLVDTLGKQLTRLAELAEQQEQALHVQALRGEAAHLSRSQDDLRKQLDHLLGRRQALWRTTRARPEEDLRNLAGREDAADRVGLEEHRSELVGEIDALANQLGRLTQEREAVAKRRTGLLSDATLESLQSELNELQARLRAPQPGPMRVARSVAPWRASEWFAKLTDGKYSGLRLTAGGRQLLALGRGREETRIESLPPAEQRLAAFSLRLALVAGFAERGIRLPLILTEPFDGPYELSESGFVPLRFESTDTGLTSRQIAILANVLDDFGRLGFQVLVFTDNAIALERFRALGVPLLGVSGVTPEESVGTISASRFAPEAQISEPTSASATRIVKQTTPSEYLLKPEDAIERFPVPIANREAVFSRSRVRTIEDLLSADPSAVAEELDRDDVTAELVALWQTHTSLVCFVPGMTFADATLLTALGITSTEDLADADATELNNRLRALVDSDCGERLRRRNLSASDLEGWIARAERGCTTWRNSSAWRGWERHRGERRQRVERNAARSTKRTKRRRQTDDLGGRGQRLRLRSAESDRPRRRRRSEPKRRVWRFFLETQSPVVDAPSIGPKMAIKLDQIGVRTVADLFAADPSDTASAIASSKVTDETVVAWQHQAQLVCRIPQIRGHDAQILVECGFTQPEEIAAMKPAELLEFVEPFCSTSEGQKLLRGSKAPDLAEVTDWITWAGHCRMLDAA